MIHSRLGSRSSRLLLIGVSFFCLWSCQGTGQQSGLPPVWVVPDGLTFLNALADWSPRQRFPIFIGETPGLAKFLTQYGSDSIIYAQPATLKGPIDRELIGRVLLASWREGGLIPEPALTREGLRDRQREIQGAPGMVLSRIDSSELFAGLALASGRGQMFDLLETTMEGKQDLQVGEAERLRSGVEVALDRWHVPYREWGDAVDYLTLAINLPLSYGNGYAVDDFINRCGSDPDSPSFYVGRLIEAEPGMALYQAMCSLFLPVKQALFFDQWPATWQRSLLPGYWEVLDRIPSVLVQGQRARKDSWVKLTSQGNPFGLAFINSFGDAQRWGDATAADIPDSGPLAVIFRHNASAADPWDPSSLAGTWLRKGAFIYSGALSDPLAGSWPGSEEILNALLRGVPISSAILCRDRRAAAFASPWRLVLFGDPLYCPRFDPPEDEGNASRLLRLAAAQLKAGDWEASREVLHRMTSAPLNGQVLGEFQRENAWQILDRLFQAQILESLEHDVVPARSETLFWKGYWNGDPLSEGILESRLSARVEGALRAYRTLLAKGKLNAFERGKLSGRIADLERNLGEGKESPSP